MSDIDRLRLAQLNSLLDDYFKRLDDARRVQRRAGNAHLDSQMQALEQAESELRTFLGLKPTFYG